MKWKMKIKNKWSWFEIKWKNKFARLPSLVMYLRGNIQIDRQYAVRVAKSAIVCEWVCAPSTVKWQIKIKNSNPLRTGGTFAIQLQNIELLDFMRCLSINILFIVSIKTISKSHKECISSNWNNNLQYRKLMRFFMVIPQITFRLCVCDNAMVCECDCRLLIWLTPRVMLATHVH